jgi:hypothetical protein
MLTARVIASGPRVPAVTALPAETATPASDPLAASAAAYLATRQDVVSATVYDLVNGKTWTIGKSTPAQDEASIVKVDILEALLARHRDGLPAADQALAQQMIEDSDNDGATALWDAAGIALLRLLIRLNPLISDVDRTAALRLMEQVTPEQRWGVSGGVPSAVRVALKNGWLPLNDVDTDWQINSIGWVSGQGRNYLIAVLTTRNATEAYGIATISHLSTLVWRALG